MPKTQSITITMESLLMLVLLSVTTQASELHHSMYEDNRDCGLDPTFVLDHLIGESGSPSCVSCGVMCTTDPLCLAFAYNKSADHCQLFNANVADCTVPAHPQLQYMVLDIDLATFDECRSNPCPAGSQCTDGLANYTCACIPGYEAYTREGRWRELLPCETMADTSIWSPNDGYHLDMQADGNLCLYQGDDRASYKWCSMVTGSGNSLLFDVDNQLKVLSADGGTVRWTAPTTGQLGLLKVTDTGFVQLLSPNGTIVWQEN